MYKVQTSSSCCDNRFLDIVIFFMEKNTHNKVLLILENYFLYYSSKTYVVGTPKNRLNETVLLSTENTCLN